MKEKILLPFMGQADKKLWEETQNKALKGLAYLIGFFIFMFLLLLIII